MLKRNIIVKMHCIHDLIAQTPRVARQTLLWLLTMLVPLTASAATLTFGVVPQQSASRLARQWTPIIDAMSDYVGEEIIFATAPDIPTFEDRLKKGEYDFAYMNPYHFTVYNEHPGYRALAHAKQKQIKGIIVVRKDSGITQLSQLTGSQLAFPSPAAFAASILTRSHLLDNGIEFTPAYVSSHDSVYLSVARGLYPAGGGVMRTFNSMPDNIRQQLIPLWSTQGFTPHAIAVNPNIEPQLARQIQHFLIRMDSHSPDKELLIPLKINGFVAAEDSQWDDVRALNIDLLSGK